MVDLEDGLRRRNPDSCLRTSTPEATSRISQSYPGANSPRSTIAGEHVCSSGTCASSSRRGGTSTRASAIRSRTSQRCSLPINNGITATADGIATRESDHGLVLTQIRNLQIVNGGQTTASIHAAFRKKVPLAHVFVQMKLSIVDADRAETIVPLISEFANSQNRVNAADFFANHPFHVRVEEMSRRLYAPSQDGTLRESKWFYERARGQYQDMRGKLSRSEQKKFELEYPKRQLFTKTDLAKYSNVWEGRPDIVSKGAQKNFAAFALYIGKAWEKAPDAINEKYYQDLIAKAVIFRSLERLVPQQAWYESGFRANIVAYAIAKLVHDVKAKAKYVNLGDVWKGQRLSQPLEDALLIAARSVHEVLTSPPSTQQNVTEWAKQQACWERVAQLEISWPRTLDKVLMSGADVTAVEAEAVKAQRVDNAIGAQTRVVSAGADVWQQVRAWGINRNLLTEKEQGILEVCGAMPGRIPTEKQCEVALKALARLHGEGCRLGREIV